MKIIKQVNPFGEVRYRIVKTIFGIKIPFKIPTLIKTGSGFLEIGKTAAFFNKESVAVKVLEHLKENIKYRGYKIVPVMYCGNYLYSISSILGRYDIASTIDKVKLYIDELIHEKTAQRFKDAE